MRVLFLGPPGCGKGTQATRLCAREGWLHLSTGDLLRAAIAAGTPLGRQAKPFVDQGRLVPDALVIGLVRERLDAAPKIPGFVLDGFPRTVPQADALDAALAGRALEVVVYYLLSDADVLKRSLGRGRSDDTEPVIRERLREYHARTEPLLARYRGAGLLQVVDASGTVEQVDALTRAAIEARAGRRG